jgi:hypothetical protein
VDNAYTDRMHVHIKARGGKLTSEQLDFNRAGFKALVTLN